MSFEPKRADTKRKGMSPVWRAVGFVLLFLIFGGSWIGAKLALDWLKVPANFARVASLQPSLPPLLSTLLGSDPTIVSLILAIVISILSFAMLTMAWAFVRDDSDRKQEVRLSDVAKMYGKKRGTRRSR